MIEVVGMKDVASGLTPMWLALAIPCTFSEAIALTIVKGTKSYLGTQLFTGLMYIAAACCLLVLRGWKINHRATKPSPTENKMEHRSDFFHQRVGSNGSEGSQLVRSLSRNVSKCVALAKVKSCI